MAYVFPTHLVNPTSLKPTKIRRVLSGGQSLTQVEDVVEIDSGGLWSWTLSGIALYSPKLLRLWEAWDNHLGGGSVECWLPVASVKTSPRPSAGGGLMTPSNLVYDGDEFFPTDVRRASAYITSSMTSAAAMGATQISLTILQGARVMGGEKFSIIHPNGPGLYSIGRAISRSGQSATVQIWPPLRDDVSNGALLNFDWPMMRARLQPGYDMSGAIEYGVSDVEVSFIEATGNA